ncbi:pseudouridine synthase PUS7 [Kluyveromyces lactis]|uniref:KLLA0F11253p n=1 Tax=Kluyveromyces lactis (strain ATCC 8585 / CBS 2359 / DSM 70799 / NBRC 1267 / NRRL Y-1140 / WM37) TaxID=284590 RepID=Q6CKE7_KLULA|nr:uncharacterized protein KLLA0_F11253g [Kluyveromyces lactis]CAG98300.1 KLLA0F11253p [Kluyveromyces lactis]|eukprot:XP_455592.1 uncharacterized protein KLLA0_F11253g [Kluyveromyces lactis]
MSDQSLKRESEAAAQQEDIKRTKVGEGINEGINNNNITEKDVGITHYLSMDNVGFNGQIKQRYTDFLVNEITKQGEVVHLTDKGFNMPKKPKPTREQIEQSQKEELEKRQGFKVDEGIRNELVELLGEEDVQKIEAVYRSNKKIETSKAFDDKLERTKIHQLLRRAFDNKLESVTTDSNHFIVGMASRQTRVSKEELIEQTKDANGVENWGYGPSKSFIHFTVYKENKDTMDVANTLSKFMRIPTRLIRFSGTKDRRAVTCQRMSLSKIGLDRLNGLNKGLKGVVLGGYKFEDEPLNLGDLQGNEFTIAIRDVSLKNEGDDLDDILANGMKSLEQNGFINYFGMQRFGTFSVSTHQIGQVLLSGNWKQAVDLIMAEQENVLPISKEARRIWAQTRNPIYAAKAMPHQCLAENAILNALCHEEKCETSNDYPISSYHNAILKIPRNLRTMYVHAYQSYVWNMVASERIKLFGLNVIEGDLVVDETSAAESDDQAKQDEDDFDEDLRETKFIRARPVTAEEVAAQTFTVNDVVLPTPGFDIVYPSNENLRQLYVDVMAKDNMDPFDMKRKVRDFSLAGSYRNVINKPTDIEYQVVSYENPTDQLINTDLEILNANRGKDNGQKYIKSKLERYMKVKDGNKKAVIIKFKLGVSAYATMVLRELMKVETSRRGDMCNVSV